VTLVIDGEGVMATVAAVIGVVSWDLQDGLLFAGV
jgi:hypothetical protein